MRQWLVTHLILAKDLYPYNPLVALPRGWNIRILLLAEAEIGKDCVIACIMSVLILRKAVSLEAYPSGARL